MKSLGKAAIICTVILFVFLIPGTILTAIGIKELATNDDFGAAVQQFIDDLDIEEHQSIHVGGYTNVDETFTVVVDDSVETIKLNRIAGEIVVTEGDTDELTVRYVGSYPANAFDNIGVAYEDVSDSDVSGSDIVNDSPIFDCVFNEDSIELALNHGNNGWNITGFNDNVWNGEITVTLPAGYDGTLVIDEAAGEMKLRGLKLEGLEIIKNAVEIEAEACSIMFFTADAAAANIEIEGAVGGVALHNCMSNIEIKSAKPFAEPSVIKNCMGNVEIELPASAKLNPEIDNCLGNMRIADSIRSDRGVDISIENCMGNVTVEADD
ncbi:MAG: hypothetical protein E7559_01850 [Ruminococcaceae bacterium]|nr:hypothetical protein [Oscillospiraceae bacterium]